MATSTFTIPRIPAPLAPEHSRQIADRIVRAYREFAETLQGVSGCTADEASAVTRYYLKHKLAKLDGCIGRISVKHGAYLDERTIRRAIDLAK